MMEIVLAKRDRLNVWDNVYHGAQGARWSRPTTTAARLQTLHVLYERLGSLGAVGKQVGLTRERVRQLLVKGTQRGLFAYSPRKYPCVPKERIIEEYTRIQSLSRVARLNRISENHLKKLLTEYSITEPQLARYRLEGRRARCAAEYLQMVKHAGRHLSSGDLHQHSAGVALYARIIRCWGSIHTFRRALKIPKPPRSARRLPGRVGELAKVRSAETPSVGQRRYSGGLPVEVAVG
jgi:hypothetical protein